MKKILVLSGKGGTGKTTITSALITLLSIKAYADCDVDAPNLHLVCDDNHWEKKDTPFFGMPISQIDTARCTGCGRCLPVCRFDAIIKKGNTYSVDPYACEGCGVCQYVCPEKAISDVQNQSGTCSVHKGNDTIFSTAQLTIGSGNSGKLVSQVKKNLEDACQDISYAIIDGSPGIGCPVIASLSGVNLALLVTEPTASGLSDLKRIVHTARIFSTSMAVCINKYDLDDEGCKSIEAYCRQEKLPLVGHIPYDREVSRAINRGETIAKIDCPARTAIVEMATELRPLLR